MIAIRPSAAAITLLMAVGQAYAAAPETPRGASGCSGCHATKPGIKDAPPSLQGRLAEQTVTAMQDFRSGQRSSTVMGRIARGFSDAETAAIAKWWAEQQP